MQLDIRTSSIFHRVNVLNNVDTVIHIFKAAEGSWSVRQGPFTVDFKYVEGKVSMRYLMHGIMVNEGMSRYHLYADALVERKILVKVENGYELHPKLLSSIEALEYLYYRS